MTKRTWRVFRATLVAFLCTFVPMQRASLAAPTHEQQRVTALSPVDSLRVSFGAGAAWDAAVGTQLTVGFHLPVFRSLRWGVQGGFGGHGLFDRHDYRAISPSLALPFGSDKIAIVFAGGVGLADVDAVSSGIYGQSSRESIGLRAIANASAESMFRIGALVLTAGVAGNYIDGRSALLFQLGLGVLLRARPNG